MIGLFPMVHWAQQITLRLANAPQKAAFEQIRGEKRILLDSLQNQKGIFQISLHNRPLGMYRIGFSHSRGLLVIHDGETV